MPPLDSKLIIELIAMMHSPTGTSIFMQFRSWKRALSVWIVSFLSFEVLNNVVSYSASSRVNLLRKVVHLRYHDCKVERLDVLEQWNVVVLICTQTTLWISACVSLLWQTRTETIVQNNLVIRLNNLYIYKLIRTCKLSLYRVKQFVEINHWRVYWLRVYLYIFDFSVRWVQILFCRRCTKSFEKLFYVILMYSSSLLISD